MFRQGKPRAFIHNLRLATMLSFVAGVVNISGVLAINTLTTNVTGHFAFFAEEFVIGDYSKALAFASYILFFLLGAFCCSLLVEFMLRRNARRSHAIPMLIEIGILVLVPIIMGQSSTGNNTIACALLFGMGLQNALVTKISQATVRTTHLTGLFTDLGIELSQLFFYKDQADKNKLARSIYLRIAIIGFFFVGCVIGGFGFSRLNVKTLFIAAAVLVAALAYDNLKLSFLHYKKKLLSD
ncbi:MAG TPA: YoaK family protein [Chryseosolibacter sp.]